MIEEKQFKLKAIFDLGSGSCSLIKLNEYYGLAYQSISNHARDLMRSAYTTISKHHGIDYRIRKELGVTRRK